MSSRARGPGAASGPGPPAPGIVAVLLLAVLFVATQYPGVLTVPFVGDDYFSLDKTREAPFAVVWVPQALVSHFYRPWSRELHYWVLQRLFGLRVEPYHAVSVALWAGIVALYFAFVRRLAGGRVAALATAAIMTLAGWGVLIVWSQGAQDLWMMLFALACFHAVARGRTAWACAAQLLALLSKETAALLPLMVFVLEWRVLRRAPGEAARRAAPESWAASHSETAAVGSSASVTARATRYRRRSVGRRSAATASPTRASSSGATPASPRKGPTPTVSWTFRP